MQFKNLSLAIIATVASTAVAEFAIITTPFPTNLIVLTDVRLSQSPLLIHRALTTHNQLPAYKSSILSEVSAGLASLTASSNLAAASSAHAGLASFAATATYSIPAAVTSVGGLETLASTPAWYSALPSNVKSYYDEWNREIQGLVDQAILGTSAAASGTQNSEATGASASAGSSETGAANANAGVVGVLGAGLAAAFAGVVAL